MPRQTSRVGLKPTLNADLTLLFNSSICRCDQSHLSTPFSAELVNQKHGTSAGPEDGAYHRVQFPSRNWQLAKDYADSVSPYLSCTPGGIGHALAMEFHAKGTSSIHAT
jgi:hypothetical protein